MGIFDENREFPRRSSKMTIKIGLWSSSRRRAEIQEILHGLSSKMTKKFSGKGERRRKREEALGLRNGGLRLRLSCTNIEDQELPFPGGRI
jgi:hypothetical protein